MRRPATLVSILAVAAAVGAALWSVERRSENCLEGPGGISVCAASDMARLPPTGPVPLEGSHLDLKAGGVLLHAGRNETVAFQLILGAAAPITVEVIPKNLHGPDGATLLAEESVRGFLAHYVRTEPAGYSWGPASRVLPWPEYYPDALIPFRHGCLKSRVLVDAVKLPSARGPHQSLWFDIFVPHDTAPGSYAGHIELEAGGDKLEVPLTVVVRNVALAERPSIDAVGEIYYPYLREGVGDNMSDERWQRMAHCYQQMAHRHRMVFIERTDRLLEAGLESSEDAGPAWRDYDLAFDPILSGELFTRANGYIGPGQGVPVAVWRTPWPQPHNGRLKGPLPEAAVTRYEGLARAWDQHAQAMDWTQSRFFAYIFDEIDGVRDYGEASDEAIAQEQYLQMAHVQIERVQGALDAGATERPIDLIWTSHTDPGQWENVDGFDLSEIIRLWAPNAMGASPDYLGRRAAAGDRVWFYHAGHPHVGVHSINASGIDMRTWGVIAARYGFHGQLMWAVNFGDAEDPYGKPSYKNMDDRFGNGTMVYPGAMLPTIGHRASPGPIPSMRLKAWRRGLQDADLVEAARRAGRGAEADELLRQMIPTALGEASGEPSWPQDPQAWHDFRARLLDLAEEAVAK